MDNSKSDAVTDALGKTLQDKAPRLAYEAYNRAQGRAEFLFPWDQLSPATKQVWSTVAATLVNVTVNAVLAGKVALYGR